MAVTLDMLRRALDPIRRRVRLLISRAVLTAAADDSSQTQRVDLALLADEEREGVARVQQYGLSSVPPEGSEAVCLSVGGVRDHLVAIAVDHTASRPIELKVGEVALWTKKHGVRVLLRDDGKVALGTEPEDLVALAPLVLGELNSIHADLATLKDAILAHTHQAGPYLAVPTTSPCELSWSVGDVAAEEVLAK